jgi:hypothetical protein
MAITDGDGDGKWEVEFEISIIGFNLNNLY